MMHILNWQEEIINIIRRLWVNQKGYNFAELEAKTKEIVEYLCKLEKTLQTKGKIEHNDPSYVALKILLSGGNTCEIDQEKGVGTMYFEAPSNFVVMEGEINLKELEDGPDE